MLSTPLRFLSVLPAELSLATVLKSGQAFRWERFDVVTVTRDETTSNGSSTTEGTEWAMGWGDRTVVLRQDAKGIHYRSLFSRSPSIIPSLLADLKEDTTRKLLVDYFKLDVGLVPLYAQWAATDPHFAKKIATGGERLEGIRVLRQDPWETLITFICSSNNNIGRIALMVKRVSESLGQPLPHPSSFTRESTVHTPTSPLLVLPFSPLTTPLTPLPTLFSFPTPQSLALPATSDLLRSLGFGYRAPFIQCTAELLLSLPSTSSSPHAYLASLRHGTFEGDLVAVREKLVLFKGVGRKVADCVALFGLGWDEVVPVDTHVFQIAIRDYAFSASKSTALTPDLHNRVAAKLSGLWGPRAGWAQQVLFFADLKPAASSPTKAGKKVVVKAVVVKAKWELELEELMKTPVKRGRTVGYAEEQEDYPTPKSMPRGTNSRGVEPESLLKRKRKV